MRQFTSFPYKHVLVLGLARSGTAAATLLLHNDINVRINDGNPNMNKEDQAMFTQMGADIILGSHPLSVLEGIDLIVKNPGIRYDHPLIVEGANRSIPVVTEVELAGYIAEDQMIGITGSNGKTTTTTLITRMFEADEQPVQIAGNIGVVASEVVETLTEDATMVIELSSFQLQGTKQFKPHIAILLNVFPAHLDYHGSMEAYVEAKKQIFTRQTADDILIYNADQSLVANGVEEAHSHRVPFSTKEKLLDGAWQDKEWLYYKREKVIQKKDITLVGDHNIENILAAICAVKQKGVSNESIKKVLTTFTGVEHRLQFVATLNGRKFYNDSKATNMLATEKALSSFSTRTILLAGGLDRGDDFTPLAPSLKHVCALITFGETSEKLQALGKEAGIPIIKPVETMEEAVKTAYDLSKNGDIILLSPACASWDQYATFEERGDMFSRAVHRLA
ncbi:MAG TPA: UDP-N-acetylmuramoyl-L-alanine--D-glutamate ligase [Bacillota bacterium]|nr:UDP-N-acetylmuramoyl-L-alanine--D-glutamate ligase [Bacillota bacterium]